MPKLSTHEKLGKLSRIQFTQAGYNDLVKQLQKLKEDRPAAVKELARARELGDLSENGLYTAAKARLISIDNQIFRCEMTMKLADIVESNSSGEISIGSKVEVEEEGKLVTYQIVGDTETNPKERKVSPHSPIGRVLLGKVAGNVVTFEIPSGKKQLVIKKVL